MSASEQDIQGSKDLFRVSNAAARDMSISLEARGMLVILLSMPDERTFRRSHLMKLAGVGKDKYHRIMRELKDAGYLEVAPTRDESGTFTGSSWVINR